MRTALRSFPHILPALVLVTGMHSSAQTTEDGFQPKVTGSVRCATAMPSGKLWIGGEITQVNSTPVQNLACLQWDGTAAKGPIVETNGAVLCLLPMADKSLWVGGAFSEVSEQPRAGLARLREFDGAGLLDHEFSPEFDGEVRCLLADGDGVLVGGNFTRVNGLRRAGVVRLLQNGEVDPAFDAKLEGELGIAVNAMARQPDGKILLGGLFDMAGNQAVTNLARLYPSGVLDSRFLGSADGEVHAIGVQASSNIVIGGDFLNVSAHPAAKLARLNRHGDVVNTLGGFDERVSTIGIQPDGKVLVGGRFGPVTGAQEGGFVRLTAELGVEKSDPRVVGEVSCCMPQSDGRVLVGGSFTRADTRPSYGLARLDSNMRADVTVGSRSGPLGGAISTAVQQPDEKLLFAGTFTGFAGFSANGFTRTDSSAGRDTTFLEGNAVGPGVSGIQVRRDQKLWAYGQFTFGSRRGIVRLQPSGSIDTGFNAGLLAGEVPVIVNAIADHPDDQLLLGGNFTTINQSPASMIARVTSNGSLSKASLPVLKGAPTDLLTSPTGELTIAGMFPGQDQESSSPSVRRYAPNGTIVSSYALSAESKVNGMCRLPDGNTLVWGLRPLGGEGNLVRLGVNGKVDSSFAPYFSGEVRSVSVQADGSMLVLGAFTTYRGGNVTRGNLDGFVQVGPDLQPTSVTGVTSMNPPSVARAGLVQADGKFLFWGGFTATKGASRTGLARLSTVVPASQELNIVSDDQSYPKIVWQRSGSAPQVERVWFSTSTNGVTYSAASEGRWVNGRWELDKFAATAGHPLWIRAEGRVPSISRIFTITNRGNDWLTLGEPVVPEGFIAGALSTTHLLPGEQATVEVTSDLSRAGAWTGELVLPSNDLDESEFVIPLKSEALTPLRTTLLKPRAVRNRKTGLREQTIRVRNAAGITYAGYRIVVSGLPQGVEVRNANSERLPDGSYVIVVNQALGPFANTELKLEYSFPKKTPAKLIPRITTEAILMDEAE
ncbi:MAG: hypothetical protein EOP84_02800 [Verrucomicrobiaceae bacterium]|nr:MAG: hypothetical protein EOP84_02800 [Verrucomicrobiaceae bacterium]